MNQDNVKQNKPVIVGEKKPNTLREKLKAKLKDYIRKKMTEISGTGAAGGGGGDGSAGPVKTPYAFGKTDKDSAAKSMPGGKVVGTLKEKQASKPDGAKSDSTKSSDKQKAAPTPYQPIIQPKPELDPAVRLKKMEKIKAALNTATADIDNLYKTRKQAVKKSDTQKSDSSA